MSDPKRIRASLLWAIGLTVLVMSPSVISLIAVLMAFNEYRLLILPFILQGSVIACWFVGLAVVVTCILAMGVKRNASLRILIVAILVLTVISVITSLVAGIELTKAFTSPVTLTEQLGVVFAKILGNSQLTPKGLRGLSGEAVIDSFTKLATSIAVLQLIGILPFPLNVMLFFMYYKFLTGLIFCMIPVASGAWAVYIIYDLRKDNQKTVGDPHSREEISEDTRLLTAHPDDREPLVKVHRHAHTPVIGRQPSLETIIQSPTAHAPFLQWDKSRY